jgi:hypothetical protein
LKSISSRSDDKIPSLVKKESSYKGALEGLICNDIEDDPFKLPENNAQNKTTP